MRRWGAAALIGTLAIGMTARELHAQGPIGTAPVRANGVLFDTTTPPPRHSAPAFVHYGKWVTLGSSIVLGVMAHAKNQDAETTYRSLRQRCFDTPANCLLGADGRYLDPGSEQLYDRTRALDHQASRLLIGAEISFLASATGFVWELMHRQDQTPTIPFEPRVEAGPSSTRVSFTVRF